jgi:hypothetical protein
VLTRRVSRLPELGRTCLSDSNARLRSAITLLLSQYPVGGFGEMTCDSNGGAAMPFGWMQSVIEQTDVLLAMSLQSDGAVEDFTD